MDIDKLTTEMRNVKSMNLDTLLPVEIVELMNEENKNIIYAIDEIKEDIGHMITEVIKAFNNGGRLIYIGAGTSGRLGILDAVECPPTFGTDPEMVQGLIAGGSDAIYEAQEGAEDSKELAIEDLKKIKLNEKDVLIGLAASGRTPYVIGGIEYANEIGSTTGAIACNKNSDIGKISDIKMEAVVGPEVLTGSTRLKSGTVQKIICNMISTGSMVGIGKIYENLMIDVKQTNEKLNRRAENILMEITGVNRDFARKNLDDCNKDLKLASLHILSDLDIDECRELLKESKGHLRKALELANNNDK